MGRKTASGEILDTITATEAHRSLPLTSYAKVTNLNNGRFAVVKINDRVPFTPGRILDLSPRAATPLDRITASVTCRTDQSQELDDRCTIVDGPESPQRDRLVPLAVPLTAAGS